MRVLIVGGGQVGSEVARRLSSEFQDVVLIEQDEDVIEKLENHLDAMVIRGNGTSLATLRAAGIDTTDILIAVTEIDEVNILASMTAKKLGVPRTVARIRNPEFEDGLHAFDFSEIGVDIAINPERVTAREIARHIKTPELDDIAYFGDNKVLMLSFIAQEGSDMVGNPISLLPLPGSCIIAAIVKPNREVIIPTGQDVVEPGDKIYLIGRHDSVHRMGRLLRGKQRRQSVVIFGAGMIGFEVAKLLESDRSNGMSVKIIEKDLRRCEEISADLKRTLVLHGDATDAALLQDEAADNDISVALLGDDEVNLMATLLAKTYGVKRSISEVIKPEYDLIFDRTGIDHSINPRLSTVSQIVRLIRKGDIISLSILENDRAEIVELNVPPTARIVGHRLADAGLPRGLIVGTVIRQGGVHIPSGDTKIMPGDRLVIFVKKGVEEHIARHFG